MQIDITNLVAYHLDLHEGEQIEEININGDSIFIEYVYRTEAGTVDFLAGDSTPYVTNDKTELEIESCKAFDRNGENLDYIYDIDTVKIENYYSVGN